MKKQLTLMKIGPGQFPGAVNIRISEGMTYNHLFTALMDRTRDNLDERKAAEEWLKEQKRDTISLTFDRPMFDPNSEETEYATFKFKEYGN